MFNKADDGFKGCFLASPRLSVINQMIHQTRDDPLCICQMFYHLGAEQETSGELRLLDGEEDEVEDGEPGQQQEEPLDRSDSGTWR